MIMVMVVSWAAAGVACRWWWMALPGAHVRRWWTWAPIRSAGGAHRRLTLAEQLAAFRGAATRAAASVGRLAVAMRAVGTAAVHVTVEHGKVRR